MLLRMLRQRLRFPMNPLSGTFCVAILAVAVGCAEITELDDDSVIQEGQWQMVVYLGMRSENRIRPTKCGEVSPQTGILFFEALRFALDQVNSNASLLFGTKLGFTLYDTCQSTARLKSRLRDDILGSGNIGVLGPPTSDEALFAAQILGIFGIPIISPSATGKDLEDREKYGNFYRTVPSDRHQLYALIDIIKHFKWTYVIVVNSFGNYGQRGMDMFVQMLSRTSVCLASRFSLPRLPTDAYYESTVRAMNTHQSVRVIILYGTVEDTRGLLLAVKRLGIPQGRFIWVASTYWGNGDSPVQDLEAFADGSLVLNFMKKPVPGFRDYFLGLNPSKANYSWFDSFWETVFNCSLYGSHGIKPCGGTERLAPGLGFQETSTVHVVSEAVFTYACVIRQIILDNCPGEDVADKAECIRKKFLFTRGKLWPIVSKKLHARNLTCSFPYAAAKFDSDGGVRGYFDILNFRAEGSGYKYVNIGKYESNSTYYVEGISLTVDDSEIRWPNGSTDLPQSVCSLPCAHDEVTVQSSDFPRCCWSCHKCQPREIVFNNTCVRCSVYFLPTPERTSCFALPSVYVDMAHSLSIVLILFSAIGLAVTTSVLVIFIKYWESRVVKAAGRELSSIMLIGLYLCFLAPIFFLSKPSPITCAIQRFIVGVSFTTCYTPLLLKTNRIYRIFMSAKKSLSRPTMISPSSQIMICSALVCIQILLGVMWVVGNPPGILNIELLERKEVYQMCSESKISVALNLAICVVMMLICTYFAFKTRKFPKNYNESKSIGITMYLSCFLWGVFVPMYLYSNDFSLSTKPYLLSIFCIVIAFVSLSGLFGSRIYVILFPNVALRGEEDKSFSTGIQTKKSTLKPSEPTENSSPSPRVCRCHENSHAFLNSPKEPRIKFDSV